MKLYSIETENFKLDGGAMFGVVPKSIWQKKYPADENNLCNLAMRCLLIDTGEQRILIDCGMGNTMAERLLPYYYVNGDNTLLGSLRKAGYLPESITDVVLTHLHFDHCGGAVTKKSNGELALTFPAAQYWVGEEQWNTAHNPNRREKPSFLHDNIMPLAASGAVQLIQSATEIAPGITLALYNGHTAGQIIPFIQYKGKTLVYVADFIPTAVHVPVGYVCGYDVEPIITMKEREQFLEEAVELGYVLFFEHDISVECCSLQRTERGVAVARTFSLQDFIAGNY